jgi:hypothetical protein
MHGNTGKKNRKRRQDDPEIVALREHFEEISSQAEVTAMRFVREETGEITERDANDNSRYLPTAMGKRRCYGR